MRDPEFQDDPDRCRYRGARVPRKPDLNIWQRMSRIMEVVIYVLLILAVAKLFTPEWERQKELQTELEKLKGIKVEKEEKVDQLRQEHTHLISDRKYMESVARDRLNLQREGEYIIRIER